MTEALAEFKTAKSNVKNAKSTVHLESTIEVIESLRYQAGPGGRKPWMDENDELVWHETRIRVAQFVWSQSFETIMGLIIVGNLVLIMWEADQDAKCFPEYYGKESECPWRSELIVGLQVLNIVLLTIYSIECLLRGFVDRSRFFCNSWNVIDFLTVVLGWLSTLLAGSFDFSLLRLSRLVRVVRAARVFISVPELYLLISGLYSSIKAIIFGSLMLAVVISFWAVISVELFHPHTSRIDFKNCDRCQHSFHTVFEAGVTLFQQIVAGDSWGQISIPLIDLAPWTAPFLFFIMMTVSLGMLNLILAVIVERAAEARSNDQERKLKKKEEDRARNMVDLATLCASMDSDGSGSLSLEEMLDGFNNSEAFQKLMQYMDIQRDDIETIFNVLDDDRSGEVSYYEFCKHLGSFFERDPKIVNSVVKYSMMEIRQVIKEEVVDCLQQHTKMLQELRLSLDKLRHDSAGAPPKQKPLGELLPKEEMELPALKSLQNLLSLESAESEMKPLLSKAEELAASALLDTLALLPDAPGAHGHPHGESRRLGRERSSSRSRSFRSEKSEKSERSDHEASPENPNRKLQASKVLGQELEERFVLLCTRFQEHLGEAETVQDRCRKILAKLEAMKGGLVQDMLSLVVEEQL